MISCDHEPVKNSHTLQNSNSPSYAVADEKKLWNRKSENDNLVTLHILISGGSSFNQALVQQFANEWTEYANVEFVFHTDAKAKKKFDISVKIFEVKNAKGKAGTSHLGTDSKWIAGKGDPSMKLWFESDTPVSTKKYYILHEFGHALGLKHEHQHPDRQFEFDEDKVLAYCKNQSWSEDECRINKLDTFSRIDYMLFPYDPKSIMHYQLIKENLSGDIPADVLIVANRLSLLDKIAIAKIYPGKITEDQIKLAHNQRELEVSLLSDYKDCDILEYTGGGRLQYYYKLKSISIYETGTFYPKDDKEDVLLNMKYDPKCNKSKEMSETVFDNSDASINSERKTSEKEVLNSRG